MKHLIVLSFFLVFFTSSYAQKTIEYVILRVEYYKKSYGLDSRLTIDLGTNTNHSLKNTIENSYGGAIRVTQSDGTVIILKNEIDFLTTLNNLGFQLIYNFPIEIAGRRMVQYLLEKK